MLLMDASDRRLTHDEELIDTLIAISVVAKRLAEKLRKQMEKEKALHCSRCRRGVEGRVAFVRERKPKLASLAQKLVEEYTKSDAGRKLGLPTSTVTSRTDKLKELLEEFLDNAIIF